ncbi:MAG: 50S ribosomal protein L10 [Verrucomicrobia subdivision 3 bacterium]|nr:50S ribosomal protein L10 [Limisphaerales bacterium]
MRAEKQFLTNEYVERLNASPYFIATDYTGVTMAQFEELRGKLRAESAEIHVVKNSVFRKACEETGVGDLNGGLSGQVAVVTGESEIAGAAKVIKEYGQSIKRLNIHFGYLGEERLEGEAVNRLADLPSLDVLRSQLLGTIQAPATAIARVIGTPATMLARAIQAKSEKG